MKCAEVRYRRLVRVAVLLWASLLTAAGCGGGKRPCGVTEAGGEVLPAFPGAEGFGAAATGGRGGDVIVVTSLKATGPGSLQAALDRPEPRVVVFAVSGVIEGDLMIPFGDLTLAGQSAPGAGITIDGQLTTPDDRPIENLVIRHIRVRPTGGGGDGRQRDALRLSRVHKAILDHVSVSFGVDETVDLYRARDVTVQWSSIESSATRGHPEGEHNFGLISGPDGFAVSILNNLFAHHKNRNPAIANGPAEVVNNVMYDVRHGFIHHNPASGPFNIYGNYFKRGPSDRLFPFYFDDEDGFAADDLSYFLAGNVVDDPGSGCDGRIENPWRECDRELLAPERLRSARRYRFKGPCYVEPSVQQPTEAYEAVLAGAGAFPRDVVTRRSVRDARERSGSWGAYEVDLMEGLEAAEPPLDGDRDGMADAWERDRGLDPTDPDDHRRTMPGGYTAIETYLNELAASRAPGGG